MVFVACASTFVCCSAIDDDRRPSVARASVLPHMVALEPNPGRDRASGPDMQYGRAAGRRSCRREREATARPAAPGGGRTPAAKPATWMGLRRGERGPAAAAGSAKKHRGRDGTAV